MKVLVTGGAGFIGSHTVDLLLEKGYSVKVLDSLEPPVHPRRVKPDYVPNEAEFILGDVCNRNDVKRALNGVDYVFYLAAHQGYLPNFSAFPLVNEVGTALLYEIILSEHLPIRKIVLASSQAVYGEGKYQCPTHGVQYPPIRKLEQLEIGDWEVKCPLCGGEVKSLPTDETRVNNHNQYSVSKYGQELYALTLGKRYDIPTTVLRYSITQGSRQSFYNAYSGILRIFSIRLLNGLPPVIYEDGQQLRDYVYAGDVAKANLLVMQDDATNYEVFNVGGRKAMTVLEYLRLLTVVSGKNVSPEIKGTFRFGDTRHVVSDISKLQKLGWQPATPIEQTITAYLEWINNKQDISDYYSQAEEVMKRQGIIRSVRKRNES